MTTLLALRSSRAATVDRLREEEASAVLQVLAVVGFALLTALAAQVQMRIYLWEVPITLLTLAVYGSGLFLGARNGMLAQLLYLLMGLFMPVYAGDGYGLAYFYAANSAGYLVGAPLAAAAVGYLSKHWKTLSGSVLSMIVGSLVLFGTGVLWLHYAAGHATWGESIVQGWLSFALIDLAKILVVGIIYAGARHLSLR